MDLLRTFQTRGYPLEYVRGRIGGRKGYRIADWEALLASEPLAAVPAAPWRGPLARRAEEEVWRGFLRELAWLYRQLEPAARKTFAPLIAWFELRTLILCLRNAGEGGRDKVTELLAESLLDERLEALLRRSVEPVAACLEVAKFLAAGTAGGGCLQRSCRTVGVGGFERELYDLFLRQSGEMKLQPVIAAFFRRLIDMRNVLALYKQVRWRLEGAPPFIVGGTLGKERLEETAEQGDMAAVFHLVARLTGEVPAAGGSPERHLLSWITRCVRRWEIGEGETGAVLAHLWRCYMEARNLGVIVAGRSLDRATLREELVR